MLPLLELLNAVSCKISSLLGLIGLMLLLLLPSLLNSIQLLLERRKRVLGIQTLLLHDHNLLPQLRCSRQYKLATLHLQFTERQQIVEKSS